MAMTPAEKAQQDAELAQIYGWAGEVDLWGAEIQERVDFVDAQLDAQRAINLDNATWREGVDAYGEIADNRFLNLGRTVQFQGGRIEDVTTAQIRLNQQVLALRQLTHTMPVWPLVLGVIAGLATGVAVGLNSDRNIWWVSGVGLAVGAIVFGVLSFVASVRNTNTVATGTPPANAQQTMPPPPPAQAHADADATQVIPVTT